MNEFWRDPVKDQVIGTVVEIFNLEGVELVRLNGLVRYINNHIGPVTTEDVNIIIKKLNQANIIDYKYELVCPHCGEHSFIIVDKDGMNKICDTCKGIYTIELNKTMFKNLFRGDSNGKEA